ncbi:MAG: NAD(P)-binding domain-containing protein [Deltaproteobacteria bacterium]|nr:NAD(P)-binding domain-containing protein [Deltaproteobacteria bacterium]
MNDTLLIVGTMAAFIALFAVVSRRRQRHNKETSTEKLQDAVANNLNVPQSLYPIINPDICIGSFSCLNACPEGDILGIVGDRPVLVEPAHCIGHGKCAAECPVDAIRLVFGTSERGVDLPEVNAVFESSRPGVHIVGELGGMGLIRNAMTQGVQLAQHFISTMQHKPMASAVDVAIVGAGPAGIATALGLRDAGFTLRMLDQSTFGGTVAQYPRHKVVMTETVDLPIVGKFGKAIISKEELIEAWSRIANSAQLRVEENVKVTGIEGEPERFTVQTSKGPVYARRVVLATGRRGSPRPLGCPGEDLPKVAYRFVDPDQYNGTSVLVVGGGDSALEAAIQLANESTAAVCLAYRGAAFGKCRQANREKIAALGASDRVQVLFNTTVREVKPEYVVLEIEGQPATLKNDYVIACLGGELPTEFLKACDIKLKRFHGEALGESKDGKPKAARAGTPAAKAEATNRIVSWSLFVLGAALIGALWWHGKDYYLLAKAARLKSPLHRMLKPAGPFGHGVGIVATGVMMLNYLYALRKRWKGLKGLGDIRTWLSFHVFVGTLSPLVIAFHAAFQSNNQLASATAASMVVLVSTGLIGRFLVTLVPQRDGKLIDLADLQRQVQGLRGQLSAMLAGATSKLNLEALVPAVATEGGFMSLAMALPDQMLGVPRRLARVRPHFDSESQFEDFARSVTSLARVRIQVTFYGVLRRYLAVWRVLHVGLSIFMVVLIVAHIGVSLYLGFVPKFFAP